MAQIDSRVDDLRALEGQYDGEKHQSEPAVVMSREEAADIPTRRLTASAGVQGGAGKFAENFISIPGRIRQSAARGKD